MASPTKKHKSRSAIKSAAAGKARKNELRRKGSTAPNLPLNKPNANELKQAQAKRARQA